MKNSVRKEDALLIRALSKGEIPAFDAIFNRYYPRIKQFLCGFVEYEEEAEDLSQDLFVKLWQNRSALEGIENLNAYLYRVAKNTVYSYFERNLKMEASSINMVSEVPTSEDLEEILFAREMEDIVNLTVERLSPQRKTIFILSRKQGLTNQEIAEQLHLSKRTVETHISAALSAIRKNLSVFLLFF